MSVVRVVDERSERPLRPLIGELLTSCAHADLALQRVRLAALDLTDQEVHGPRRCRVLLGQLDAWTLLDADSGPARDRAGLGRLHDWLASGRLEVRSAGIGAWTPDFSIFHHVPAPPTCLLGAHYFGSPQLAVGPSVTVVISEAAAARLLQRRFNELWERAHDVAPAIVAVLRGAVGGDPGLGRNGGPDGKSLAELTP